MPIRSFIDQLGNSVRFEFPPKRIVSLVPSQTELLSALGLQHEVVGITKFCIHPRHWFSEKVKVGGTKNFNLEIIAQLQPDLIIGNKEENYREGIEALSKQYPVWMSDIANLPEALQMIESIGEITNRKDEAAKVVQKVNTAFSSLRRKPVQKVLYLIWRKPWMGAGDGTFIHSMIEMIGWKNCLEGNLRYPEFSAEDIKDLRPDLILLSSEPYPFRERHIQELQQITPQSRVILVDGEMFSWYGSRLIDTPTYFNALPD